MVKQMRWLLLLEIVLLAGIFNWRFVQSCDLKKVLDMNDVRAILSGFQKTPNLLVDGLRWWHGAWIQEGINAFRPLTSYLYWLECWIGLHYGFFWVGILGFILFVVCCWLSVELAWRITNSAIGASLCAIFATTIIYHNLNPKDWLIWFPCHQELMLSVFLIGALLCFDRWLVGRSKKHLAYAWVLFIAGCLTKEYAYVFPLLVASLVLLNYKGEKEALRIGLIQTFAMLAFVVMLWFYRNAVLENPYNPTLKPSQFVRKPLLFMFNVFGRYLLTGDYWFVGWAILIFVMVGIYFRWVRVNPSTILMRSLVWTMLFLTLNWVYLWRFAPSSVSDAILFLLDQPFFNPHLESMASMLFQLYALYLLWRYRDREPTALSFTWVFLAHLPVLDYIGWHYTIPAWFFWSVYWSLVAKLIWLNIGQPIVGLNR